MPSSFLPNATSCLSLPCPLTSPRSYLEAFAPIVDPRRYNPATTTPEAKTAVCQKDNDAEGIRTDTTPSEGSSRFVLGEGSPIKRAESSLMAKMNRLDNYFRRAVEREVVTSVYTALGFDNTTPHHVFYQRLLDNPAWTTDTLKQRTDVAETDIPRILTALDPGISLG